MDELRAVVYHERRVELGLENVRFYDLTRWGLADEALGAFTNYGKNNYDDCNSILPLPNNDILLSDGLIQQNPCY